MNPPRQSSFGRVIRVGEQIRDLAAGVVRATAGRLTINLDPEPGLAITREALHVETGDLLERDAEALHVRWALRQQDADFEAQPGTMHLIDVGSGDVDAMLPVLDRVAPGSVVALKIISGANNVIATAATNDLVDGSGSLSFSTSGSSRILVASPSNGNWYTL